MGEVLGKVWDLPDNSDDDYYWDYDMILLGQLWDPPDDSDDDA